MKRVLHFFFRSKTKFDVVQIDFMSFFYRVLIFPLLILFAGIYNFGLYFFSIDHMTNYSGLYKHSWFTFAILVLFFLIIFIKSVDIFLSRGSYLSINDDILYFMRRKGCEIKEIDINRIFLENDYRISIPMKDGSIFANINPKIALGTPSSLLALIKETIEERSGGVKVKRNTLEQLPKPL